MTRKQGNKKPKTTEIYPLLTDRRLRKKTPLDDWWFTAAFATGEN